MRLGDERDVLDFLLHVHEPRRAGRDGRDVRGRVHRHRVDVASPRVRVPHLYNREG